MKWRGLGWALVAAVAAAQEEMPEKPKRGEELVAGMNAFACDLYGELRRQEGNLFLSPFAISTAGAMLSVGTAGETQAEVRQAFHLPEKDELLSAWPGLRKRLGKGVGEGMTLRFANAVCAERSTPLQPSYQSALKETFSVPWYGLDFRGDPDGCVREINAWAAKQTKQEGSDILQPGDLTPETMLVLVSASYFKGIWDEPFSRSATRPRTFHLDAEREIKVPTMRREVDQRIGNREWFTVVPLAYEDSSVEMVLLVPKQVDGLGRLEEELTAEALGEWLADDAAWDEPKLTLYLPKLLYESRFDLTLPLGRLGVAHAFSPTEADLSPTFGPSAAEGFDRPRMRGIHHLAGIRVFEEGTVAYSKAGIDWGGGTPMKEVTLRVDHPFLFLIRERKTGMVLYLGRVVDPSK